MKRESPIIVDPSWVVRDDGSFSDMFSAAKDTLRANFSEEELRILFEDYGFGVRENPSADGSVLTHAKLADIALSITGIWGPEYRSKDDPWARIDIILAEIDSARRIATERYKQLRVTSMPWVVVLNLLEKAVLYLKRQRDVWASGGYPSIMEERVGDDGRIVGFPFGMKWGVLATSGNMKLPFVAYSELPMATCPGAGSCGVHLKALKHGGKKGYCYSFKSWRVHYAFLRQALNSLANTYDRWFAVLRGSNNNPPRDYFEEVYAAIRGREGRVWQPHVITLIHEATALDRKLLLVRTRNKVGHVFARLFVDGDIGSEDNIYEWMEAIKMLAPGGPLTVDKDGRYIGHVEFYGYSKCWAQFVNVDKMFYHRTGWPPNYALNLSNDSIYNKPKREISDDGGKFRLPVLSGGSVRSEIEDLPITRGYFVTIDFDEYKKVLRDVIQKYKETGVLEIKIPPKEMQHFRFSEKRIRDFIMINAAETPEEIERLLPGIQWRGGRPPKPPVPGTPWYNKERQEYLDDLHRQALHHYFSVILNSPSFRKTVRREILRDFGYMSEHQYIQAQVEEHRKRYGKVLRVQSERKREEILRKVYGEPGPGGYSRAEYSKAISLASHEVLWSLGVGGMCPMKCGNCSDNPKGQGGYHRCASKDLFKGKVIYVGIH